MYIYYFQEREIERILKDMKNTLPKDKVIKITRVRYDKDVKCLT